ncbi:uncharacterized protein LOC112592520 [Melanaphis sacchari]|uniref:uncharacterized protein LOC112592520 n=1 Tax=Melanaphis sacchari TaxID=742174 RepID=UPI000DC14AFE|nr:uncharacterized protein LOC112592520 [Melanaphis sacchari]
MMYSFDAYKNIVIMDDFEMAKSIEQNSKRDPTPTESTALSDKDQNTSQSDHQFRRPEVPSLRHYRHPTASGLNSNRGNVLTSNTYVIGGVVNTKGGVIVGDEDLGNGYVYADENIWNYYY